MRDKYTLLVKCSNCSRVHKIEIPKGKQWHNAKERGFTRNAGWYNEEPTLNTSGKFHEEICPTCQVDFTLFKVSEQHEDTPN